jgi:hypothetical protein
VSQRNPEAGNLEESAISGERMLMTHQQSSELAKTGVGWFDVRRSNAACSAAIYGHLRSTDTDCSRGKARSTRCRISSVVGATGPSHRRCRQSLFPAFAADRLWAAEPRLPGAWQPTFFKNRHAAPVWRIHKMPSKPRNNPGSRPKVDPGCPAGDRSGCSSSRLPPFHEGKAPFGASLR